MKKHLLLAVVFTIQLFCVKVFAGNLLCTPTITTGTVSPTTICAGSIIVVPYTFTDCVDPGNIFTVQLSDAAGSFAAPINIGSIATTSAGTISAIIPGNTALGTGYRIRVVSSSPVVSGADNGTDLVILPKPNASFTISSATAQCLTGNSFSFTNTSTGSITGYSWTMGDGISTTNTNPVYTYSATGNFNVTLVAIGTNSCRDSITQIATIHPQPKPNFTFNNPAPCTTPTFNFTNTSTIGSGSQTFAWSFGDGNTSTATNPSNTYPAAGAYPVKLIATSNNGCKDSISNTVNVLDVPVASFLVNDSTQCLTGNNFVFANFSTGIGNTYSWDFGDGTTSASPNPSKTYLTTGTFLVKLIVTNVNGCKDSLSRTMSVTTGPVAGFGVVGNTLCSSNLTVNFANTSTGTGNTYFWNFGDATTSTDTTPVKTYSTANTYNVKLIATDANGCMDSITQSVVVNSKPVASFTVNNSAQCVNDNLFVFTNTTTGSFASSNWVFGDGATSAITNPAKVFNTAGNYNVKLFVSNANGCTDSAIVPVTVNDKPIPQFFLSGNTGCTSNLNVGTINTSTGTGNTYLWSFGDGNTSTAMNPTNTYPAAGTYIVRLVATNIFGCKDSTERSITFANKPTAAFTVNKDTQCLNSNLFTFTNTSVGGNTYNWNFGDGIISSVTNPSKTYSSIGTYVVQLIATNVGGCKDTITHNVVVVNKPDATFTVNGGATTCLSSTTVGFTVSNPAVGNTYAWDFGDGSTSSATNPTRNYAVAGTYNVKLVVTNSSGCADSSVIAINISTKPTAAFTINNSGQCLSNNQFVFTNTSTNATTYSWDFGDGITSTVTNPSKTYSAQGIYPVRLIAFNANGCTDTVIQNITVLSKPTAGFNITGATGCTNNLTIGTVNTSTGTGVSYSWDFGDGSTSSATNPSKTYAVAGSYTIKLVATSVNGCKDSTMLNITFSPIPVASFTSNASSQCLNANSFVFTNTTTGTNTYLWNFGDGSTSAATSPTKTYIVSGTYIVKLFVTSVNGCIDSTSQTITVLPAPVASFTTSGSTGCTNNLTISTNNTSTGTGLTYAWSFGDGSTSTAVSPSKTYSTIGTYVIKLVVTNSSGCKDSTTKSISFSPKPTAGVLFTGSGFTQCSNNNAFLFNDASTGATSYFWDFGNGTTSTLANPPSYSYIASGTYVVSHIVTNSVGCSDTLNNTVNILVSPSAAFNVTYQGCSKSVVFSQTNTANTGFSSWNFGDGSGPLNNTPTTTYTYAANGVYTVKLVAFSSGFTCKDSSVQTVSLTSQPDALISIGPGTRTVNGEYCFNKGKHRFDYISSSTGTISNYLWSFGDGQTATTANASVTYAAVGTYPVKLIVSNLQGCKDSATTISTITPNPVGGIQITSGATGCTNNLTIGLNDSLANSNQKAFFSWDFGDGGATSSQPNPLKTYATQGTYTVTLITGGTIVSGTAGCRDTATRVVTFLKPPAAGIDFAANHTQCLNTNSYGILSSSVGASSLLWNFGDGFTSASDPVSHSYTSPGTYTIKLIATASNGCKDSTTETATVLPNPNAAFTATYVPCGNLFVQFAQNNTANTTFSAWYFGDGNGPNDVFTTSHTYAAMGSYTVKYFAYDATFTCGDSSIQTVTLNPNPTPNPIALTPLAQCSNSNNYSFSDGLATAVSYSWNFGDGTTANGLTVSHSYASAGTYTVKQFATSNKGCKDSATITVTVRQSPSAAFNVNYQPCGGNLTAQFSLSHVGSTPSTFWDFGDGATTSAGISTSHTYPAIGTYIIKNIGYNLGATCSDTAIQTISFFPPPQLGINVTSAGTQCLKNNNFTFTDAFLTAVSYSWNFGDGTTATGSAVSHSYATAGTYTVKEFATSANGCIDSTTTTVTLLPSPDATFTAVYQPCNNLTAQFTQTNTANTGFANWDFGDAGSSTTLFTVSHTYPATGTYIVKYIAFDAGLACSDTATKTLVFNPLTAAAFTLNGNAAQCLSGNNYAFVNSSTGANSYLWSFGDGTTSTLATPPSHTYTSVGNYIIKLLVSNTNGCVDSLGLPVTVVADAVASFTHFGATGCTSNLTLFITNTSTGAGLTYAWSFGDGSTSTATNPVKTYGAAGTYTIKLVTTNAIGCKDSATQTVTFNPLSIADFTVNSGAQCVNSNSFVFTNTSTGATSYAWDFGDGTTSTLSNPPAHVYTVAGTYIVKLVVANVSGCKDSVAASVMVNSKPVAGFNFSGATGCTNNLTLVFTNTSAGAASYAWDFGDGSTSTAADPVKIFSSTGTYIVKLVAINASGCRDSITEAIKFSPLPTAGFAVNNGTQCINGNGFVFTDNSTGAISYLWDFGDGTTSTLANPPVHTYAIAGNYIVKQVITNINVCKDSTTTTIAVNAKPTAGFNLTGTTGCTTNLTLTFNNTSTGAATYAWDFGDGSSSTTANPVKVYGTLGTYIIKLVATNANGCKDSTTQTVTFSPLPAAGFTVNNSTQCLNGNSFVFADNAVGAANYLWDFGDGTTSTAANPPAHMYTTAGSYLVKQVVTNINGCKDSITTTIIVNAKPTTGFNFSGATGCTTNLTLLFTNTSTGATSYVWDFGDGSTSTTTNPVKIYGALGTYIIKLVTTNVNGCKDSATQTVTFSPLPTAGFAVNNSTQCVNSNSFVFTDNAVGAANYLWDFGDGTTSTAANPPAHTYTTAGSYLIKQVVTNINGCKDSITTTIAVNAKPTAGFNFTGTTGCTTNLTLTFNNTSTGAATYAWDFGDGTVSTVANPVKTYGTVGAYIVKLVTTNVNGCRDSTTQTIILFAMPVAAFNVVGSTTCANNLSVVINNTSAGATSYAWDFGDGTTSTVANPGKSYTAAGTYVIKLVVTNGNGCKDSTTQSVTITTKPVASFTTTGNTACTSNLSIGFVNNSTGTGNSYLWSFGDGNTSALTNPTNLYGAIGTYTIKLVVTNSDGCKDSTTKTITLSLKPVAAFTASNTLQCINSVPVSFTNTSTNLASPAYFWDFGDGSFSLQQNPTQAYTVAGTYKVILYVTNVNGCKDSVSKMITVAAKPVVGFTIPNFNGCSNGNSITLANTSTGAVTYAWDFGDGTGSTLANPSKTYITLGTYIIKLVATNSSGCVDSVSKTITLSQKPVAAFTSSTVNSCLGSVVSFVDASTNISAPAYFWDFGDGANSVNQSPTHIYTTAGVYKVLLFVTNANGCKDSISHSVTVLAKPTASFIIPNYNGCTNSNTFAFNNTSTNAVSFVWDFGDGSGSFLTNPSKTYTTIGTYIVKLVVTSANGCEDSTTKTITMQSKPVAAFNTSVSSSCAGASVSFTDASTSISSPAYYWDFGDASSSLIQNPTHIYTTAGTYKVLLFVTNANGCKDSISHSVTVLSKPTAAFNLPTAGTCTGTTTVSFTNASTNATSYTWYFGDGGGATQANPTHAYAAFGNYSVTLIAVNINGCNDTIVKSVPVMPKPTASFSINDTSQCVNKNLFTFINNSTNAVSYFWSFGDGGVSALQSPTHNYTSVGNFTVSLTATGANGCSDVTTQVVSVNPAMSASFNISGLSACVLGNTLTFNNTSVGGFNMPVNYWDFGDGTTSNVYSPTHIYTTPGTYIIRYTLVGRFCTDSTSQTITIDTKPSAAFGVNSSTQCLISNNFTFTSASSGAISGYFWSFGDGSTSTLANPSHTYANTGTYTVTLTVTGTNGCSSNTSQTINVVGKPSISFNINNATQCIFGNVFTFTNTSPSQPGVSYFWNFGDGISSSLTTISKVYTAVGTYNVSLIATSGGGCIDSVVKQVQVVGKPTASFGATQGAACANSTLQFNNTSVGAANFLWNFGDATTSTASNPAHTYSTAGIYNVTLTAYNTGTCSDVTTRQVIVTAKTTAAFTSQAGTGCNNSNIVSFTNASTGNNSGYFWDFGDGTSSISANPGAHAYSKAGIYFVKLVAFGTNGCVDSVVTPITIAVKTTALFTINSLTQCINNNQFIFNNTSLPGLSSLSYKWDLGDGSTASAATVSKSYLLPGNYTVKLVVVNINTGCKDSTSAVVSVMPQPTATLFGSGTICQGNSFIMNVTLAGTPPFQLTYNDGVSNTTITGITTTVYGISVSPTATTKYTIVAMNDAYCSASTAQLASVSSTVIVNSVAFTQQPISQTGCVGGSLILDAAISTTVTGYSYQWQHNGANILGATNTALALPILSVSDSGNYRLAIIMPCGTVYSNNAYITVTPPAPAPVFAPVVTYCQFDSATALTAIGTTLKWYLSATGGLPLLSPPVPNTQLPGTQQYWVSNSTATNCESGRYLVTVNVSPSPKVSLAALGSTSLVPSQTVTLQATPSPVLPVRWYKDGVLIPSPTPNNLLVVGFANLGSYRAEVVGTNGCRGLSEIINVTARNAFGPADEGNNLSLYPNPATTVVNMYFDNPINENATLRLVDVWGQVLQAQPIQFTKKYQSLQMNIAKLIPGVYAIEVANAKGITIARNLFVKGKL